MNRLKNLSITLDSQARKLKIRRLTLGERTGLTQPTLRKVLSGDKDYKISSLLAVAQELGLEVVLLPTEAAAAFKPVPAEPVILSGPQAAVAEIRARLLARQQRRKS